VQGRIELIIFDLQGTLVDNKIDFVSMKREIIKLLIKKYGLNIDEELFLRRRVVEILEYAKDNVDDKTYNTIFQEISQIADKYEIDAAINSKLKADVKDVLKALRRKNYKIAILTNDGRKSTEIILNRFGLKEFFDCIVTRDDINTLKPDPLGIERILERIKVDKQNVIFIGDSIIDIQAAKNARIRGWGISGGYSTKDLLIKEGAEVVLNDLKDILQVVDP